MNVKIVEMMCLTLPGMKLEKIKIPFKREVKEVELMYDGDEIPSYVKVVYKGGMRLYENMEKKNETM